MTKMDALDAYARRLVQTYGEDLISITLYGSAARGDYREGISDLNLLVILREVDAARLRKGSALAREWVASGNPPPLLLSESEWRESADVFPIEYADIRDAHRVLHGDDLFAAVEIGWPDLRMQAERELKEKKIQLRERYLLAAESPEELGDLLLRSFPTFLALFRAILRLAGDSIPAGPDAVVRAAAGRVGFDPSAWLAILQARTDGGRLEPAADDPILSGYLDGVTRAAEWIDGVEPDRGPESA